MSKSSKSHTSSSPLHAYSTGLLQGKAYNRLHAQLNRVLLLHSLSVPEWKLLGQLYEQNQIQLSRLALLLSYDPPMVTKLVKKLEKKQLLTRSSHKKDERVKIISITSKGKQRIDEIEEPVKAAMRSVLDGISREELLVYIKVLSTIIQNTEE